MKRAIVMGASSGIGFEVARVLLERGWQVGLAARRVELLAELESRFAGQVSVARIDITTDEAVGQLLDLIGRMGGVDLYFHVSGVGWNNPQLDIDREMITMETNACGFTRMVDTMFRYMSDNGGGHIAAITSIAGTKGLGPAPAYSATKAMQAAYLQALEQLSNSRKLNIRITEIRPGFVKTDLIKGKPYPMLMDKESVARKAVDAALAGKHVAIIDWRYRILTALWRRFPRCIWRRMNLIRKEYN
ncbi:MAG: SDR family NAD(P)-dependent oxidoreductase [Prevotella sp.]|nr:SDR family NAD(P)-dependent oxidoreductase [Prevotella sp.]